jgi:hypothetical protein
MASLETLLIKVRSDTPTSFFFVVSNVAFLMFGLLLPAAAARPPPCAFSVLSPFGRRLIPYSRLKCQSFLYIDLRCIAVGALTILDCCSVAGSCWVLQDAPSSNFSADDVRNSSNSSAIKEIAITAYNGASSRALRRLCNSHNY